MRRESFAMKRSPFATDSIKYQRTLMTLLQLCCLVFTVASTCQGCKSRSVVRMANQENQVQKKTICHGSTIEFVSREDWRARSPKSKSLIEGPVKMAFTHHTAGDWRCDDKQDCITQVQQVQNFHMDTRGWDDIGYSFMIGEDGRVYEGRGWRVVGAHTQHYNSIAYGFCVIGNFMNRLPNEKALKAVKGAIDCGVQQGYIQPDYEMFGHRDGRCTECPGDQLYNHIQSWPHFSHRNITRYC